MALADEQITKVRGIVENKLGVVQDWARQAQDAASGAIDAVGTLDIPDIEITFPIAPTLADPELPNNQSADVAKISFFANNKDADAIAKEDKEAEEAAAQAEEEGTPPPPKKTRPGSVEFSGTQVLQFNFSEGVTDGTDKDGKPITKLLGPDGKALLISKPGTSKDDARKALKALQKAAKDPDPSAFATALESNAKFFKSPTPGTPAEIEASLENIPDIPEKTEGGANVIQPPRFGTAVALDARPSEDFPESPSDYPTVATESNPEVPAWKLPVVPVIGLPDTPTLETLVIPELPEISIASFTKQLPQYDDLLAKDRIYAARVEDILENRSSQLQAAMTAFSQSYESKLNLEAIEAYIEDRPKRVTRLMAESAAAIDRETVAKTNQATTAWASRNFSIAPGMLIDQVNDIELEAGMRIRQASSKINQEAAQLAKEDFDKLLAIYVSLEQNMIDYQLEAIQQAVEGEKLRVRAQMELFNATLDMYKAKQSAVNAHIEAFKSEQQAAVQRVGAYKTAVDGAIAETAINDARVQIYGSQVQITKAQSDVYGTSVKASTAPIEGYKAELIGVKAKADTAAANIETYREAIRAYASSVEAASAELRAYATEVQGQSSVASVQEANAKAYASYVQEFVKSNDRYKTYTAEQSDLLDTYLRTFRSAGNVNESFIRAHASRISAHSKYMTDRNNVIEKYVNGVTSYNKTMAERNEAAINYSMTAAENAARAQALANQAQSETDKITAGALAAKAQALAGLAQGAMSALHVSASASGTGGTSSSYSYNLNSTINWGGTTRQSESKSQNVSA